jgi:hypothetical protein
MRMHGRGGRPMKHRIHGRMGRMHAPRRHMHQPKEGFESSGSYPLDKDEEPETLEF